MSKYLITLTPTGSFFFGGDMSFSVKDNKDHNEKFSSYIIESNQFPQQTSLLGMLRFLILSNNKTAFDHFTQKILDKNNASTLIGSGSFSVHNTHTENSFGKIKSISPCILQKKENNMNWIDLFPTAPLYESGVDFSSPINAIINGKTVNVPVIKEYNPKKQYESIFKSQDETVSIEESKIFLKDQRIGIEKDYSGITNDSAYFKQICYRLENGFRFAFEAEIEMDITSYDKQIVSVGGNSSQFIINIVIDKNISYPEKCKNTVNCYGKVALLSPSFIEKEDANKSCFAITDAVPFRFLETTVNSVDYNILSKKVLRSNKYYLYKAGSVFYFDNQKNFESFKSALESKKEFRQIGYNYYKSISNN